MAVVRIENWLLLTTVDSLLTDTSIRRTPPKNGHLELVPAFVYSLYLTLYKTDISVKRTPRVGPCLSLLPLFDSL